MKRHQSKKFLGKFLPSGVSNVKRLFSQGVPDVLTCRMKNDKELKIKELIDSRLAALVLFARQWRHAAAEDIVQEAFIKLYWHEPWPDDPVAWLFTVVRNASNNQVRSEQRRKRHEKNVLSIQHWLLPPGEEPQTGDLIRELELLDSEYREIIVAKIWGGLTFEQIAELLGSSRSSVHRKYQEGLDLLQERLKVGET